MKKTICFYAVILLCCILQGCAKNNSSHAAAAQDQIEDNFLLTNNTPVVFKSITVATDEKNGQALVANDVAPFDTARFHIPVNKSVIIKIKLKPQNWYTTSHCIREKIKSSVIRKYEITIDMEEIKVKKMKEEEKSKNRQSRLLRNQTALVIL